MVIGNSLVKKVMLTSVLFTFGVMPELGDFSGVSITNVNVEAASVVKYTTTDSLNLRTGASVKNKRILTIPKGKEVSYVGKSGTWYKVKYGSKTGYVSSKYLKKVVGSSKAVNGKVIKPSSVSSVVKYKTTDSLNLRTGASVKNKSILTIPKGKEVSYVGKSGTWYKVKYGSKTGYVSSKYLVKVGTPVSSVTKPASINYPSPSVKTPGFYKGGILVVNKKYSLPSNYNPGINVTAKTALNGMLADAKRSGLSLQVISSYRTYSYQAGLYNRYKSKYGQAAADRFSARPGHSEHQTGLAFDFGGTNKSYWLEESFGGTKEGKWLASNAHKYGYILRYPKGKEGVTGYMYEPWHYRYVGTDNAIKIKNSGKTLEEYLGVKGK